MVPFKLMLLKVKTVEAGKYLFSEHVLLVDW